MSKPIILILEFAFVLTLLSCQNVAQTRVTSSAPPTKLHFPRHWLGERELPYFIEQIEVRKRPTSSGDEFFFAALPDGDYDHQHETDPQRSKPRYGVNMFAVSFSDGLRVRTATQQEWEDGSRLATKPRLVFSKGQDKSSGEIEYRHKRYAKVGKYWGTGHLSPSGRWLAVFSYNGEDPPPSFFHFLGGGSPPKGDIFWQIYDTVTGRKVFEWEARNVKQPTSFYHPLVWLEDRYFLFPKDREAQNFVVVSLPPVTPEVNPVMVQFPSRRDAAGRPLPAGNRHEVWIPLIPLSKEQAAKLTARGELEISEVRLLPEPFPGQLLFAIKEDTENRRVDRGPQRDGPSEYHLRVIGTYYYALTPDNPTQVRFATKEEWDRGRSVRSNRSKIVETAPEEAVRGFLPPHRQFTKTGTSWGTPPALSAGEWIAVFSYSEGRPAGKMFIDVYDERLGHKLLSTTLPYTVSPNDLFKGALWIEGGYVLLPLDAARESFAFWQLP